MGLERQPTYSQLIAELNAGNVKSLILVPERREVVALFNNGSEFTIPILLNDQQILRSAESSGTPLTVKDLSATRAQAGIAANLTIILMIVIGLTFLLKRSVSVANRAIGFSKSQPRLKSQDQMNIRFEDVAGVKEAAEELNEVVTFLLKPESLLKLGAKIPRGVLLVGPPGTGKTLLAKAIAGEAGVPFFSIAGSEFVELFVGVGASRVRDLFSQAKQKSPCIIFIDEIDAVGRQRGAGIGGGNDEREQTLNQLLTEMDGFADNSGVVVIAATNRPDVLDSALMRPGRFDRRISVSLPDRKGRTEILSVHARSRPLAPEVSLNDWAIKTPGFSGAELENLLNEAAILTARYNNKLIENIHIEQALERVTIGLPSSALQDSSRKRLIAYHEIGHALLASLLPHADKVDKVTLLPRTNGIAGFTRFWPDEDVVDSGLLTKGYLFNRLIVALGGRAAEIIIFGENEITQGASGDLESATKIAREMVTRFGFSQLGPVSLESTSSEVFLGRDLIQARRGYSETTGQAVDEQVKHLLLTAMDRAMKLLSPRRKIMDQLVEALIEEETLHSERFLALAGL